jgi:hypothetical protein
MTKSAMSLLLVAMMATSGFAVAQMKSGTDGGAGPTGASGSGDGGKSVTTRAAVKAEAVPMKSGNQGGEGAKPSDGSSPKAAPKMTAEEKKAKRAEARAARKARLAAKAGNTPMKDGKSTN